MEQLIENAGEYLVMDNCNVNGCDEKCIDCEHYYDVMERLYQYEQSGLTPSEVAKLVKAKEDGRLVELPCKGGQTLYSTSPGNPDPKQYPVIPISVEGFWVPDQGDRGDIELNVKELIKTRWNPYGIIRADEFGKTLFYTRKEAQQALERSKSE